VTRVLRLTLAYDGTDFRGWADQRDPAIRTIEATLCDHLERVLRERPRLSVAGRTDAGVHSRGQVVSFTTSSGTRPDRIQKALNAALAPEIVVTEASWAPAGFDARLSATGREYRYVIDTAPVPDAFTSRFVWHRRAALHVPSMRTAASPLAGEHDFRSFCRHPGAGRSTIRKIDRLTIARDGHLVVVRLRANAFCHQMVRSIVGTLVRVGEGRLDPREVVRILAAGDRATTPNIAPARGLTLERVIYGRR